MASKRATLERPIGCLRRPRNLASIARHILEYGPQLDIQFLPNLDYAGIAELAEERGWAVIFETRRAVLVLVKIQPQRRVEARNHSGLPISY